jgi:hypothetical protein
MRVGEMLGRARDGPWRCHSPGWCVAVGFQVLGQLVQLGKLQFVLSLTTMVYVQLSLLSPSLRNHVLPPASVGRDRDKYRARHRYIYIIRHSSLLYRGGPSLAGVPRP